MIIQNESLRIALAQMAPIWLDKKSTLDKIKAYILEASNQDAELVVFGEALLPGYPFWLSNTEGASFNDQRQKEIHAHYIRNAINIPAGDLKGICHLCKEKSIACYLGTIERAVDRGGHSLYCTLVYIDQNGIILSTHRKLRPTYEERLAWSPGDGNGLCVHALKDFRLGGLNCWENWMPLSRAALYGMGENVHIAVWPGALRNTVDITPFIAKESRSYSVAVSSIMRKSDIPKSVPHYEYIMENAPEWMADGGSCIANPDGSWLIEPKAKEEGVYTAEIQLQKIFEERQNFDPSGHYSRPDVLQLHLNKDRQTVLKEKKSTN